MNRMKFHNNDGSLTQYAFTCGYIQRTQFCQAGKPNKWGVWYPEIHLYLDGTYHVKAVYSNGYVSAWEVFETLAEARKAYKKLYADFSKEFGKPEKRYN